MSRAQLPCPIGERFGQWTVLGLAPTEKFQATRWRVRCACGCEAERYATSLRTGKSSKCVKCSNRVNLVKALAATAALKVGSKSNVIRLDRRRCRKCAVRHKPEAACFRRSA
jgi:hypothetical protein